MGIDRREQTVDDVILRFWVHTSFCDASPSTDLRISPWSNDSLYNFYNDNQVSQTCKIIIINFPRFQDWYCVCTPVQLTRFITALATASNNITTTTMASLRLILNINRLNTLINNVTMKCRYFVQRRVKYRYHLSFSKYWFYNRIKYLLIYLPFCVLLWFLKVRDKIQKIRGLKMVTF